MKTIYQISLMNPDSQPGLEFETELWNQGYSLIAGVDEAGRGCLAGPVVAAAVICPPNMRIKGVKDSKKMSAKARERTREIVLDTVFVYTDLDRFYRYSIWCRSSCTVWCCITCTIIIFYIRIVTRCRIV